MNLFSKTSLFTLIALCVSFSAVAGNKDRTGQAGASELLFNPWASSSGFNSLNTGTVKGPESIRLNVAGLAFTGKTDVLFSQSNIMNGAGFTSSAFAFGQKVGASGVMGATLVNMSMGDIPITTTANPDGGIGSFSPQYLNIGVAYAKAFSNSIYGGFVLRGISESIPDAAALGMSIDAGIQYVTGPDENIHFGISLRNIGIPMRFNGDGLSFRGEEPGGDFTMALSQLSQRFELPALMHIGGAYDFYFQEKRHRITAVANFTSNSFVADQIGGGAEYAFREMFMVRAGYAYEKDIADAELRTTAYTGIAAGFSVNLPLKSKKNLSEDEVAPKISLDYSFRDTNPFSGTHTFGARIML